MTDDGEVGKKTTKCGTCDEIPQKCLYCDIYNKLTNKFPCITCSLSKCRTSTFKVIKNEINQKRTKI